MAAAGISQPHPFNCTKDITAGRRWAEYIEEMELYLRILKTTDGNERQATLLYCGGTDLRQLFATLQEKRKK